MIRKRVILPLLLVAGMGTAAVGGVTIASASSSSHTQPAPSATTTPRTQVTPTTPGTDKCPHANSGSPSSSSTTSLPGV
ncbi:MAG TPA: hypothetical protein VKX16_05630 [Chloroflexota bacterium]|nr:hypothetical protein [Chloroflexota bacterium]